MITRRTLIKSAGAGAAGTAFATATSAQAEEKSATVKYTGPFEMPRRLTLLAIANADGAETLGVKSGASVIDVRRASQLLSMPAALTMQQLLQEGSAGQLTRLAEAANTSAQAKAAIVPSPASPMAGFLRTPARSSASASTINGTLLKLK